MTGTPPLHRRRTSPALRRRRRALGAGAGAMLALAVVAAAMVSGPSTSHPALSRTAARGPGTTSSTAVTTAPPTTTRPAGPPYAVADSSIIFTDPSRPTPARGSVPAHPGRTLRTIVRRPVGAPGPLPLVVFVHGWNSEPEYYEPLLDTWAAAGYLVVAPEFPGSAQNLPGTPVSDYAAQALDVSFVITQVLGGVLGPVDPNRIVAAGHSDGGTTTAILALAPQYQDPRIKAYLSLAGQIPPDVSAPWGASRTPGVLLVAVGTDDEYGNEALSTQLYDTAQMTKAFINVPGGSHLGPFVSATPMADSVRAATVAFMNLVLADPGHVTAGQLLQALAAPAGSSAYQVSAADN